MVICGIDASSSCTGLCIFYDKKLVYYTKIRPDKKINFRDNTCQIATKVVEIVDSFSPDIIYMEDVPLYANQKNGIKPLMYLGCVQGVFYNELHFKLGYHIEYIPVATWRSKLALLKGERKREKQKTKAVDFANNTFGLSLQYTEGKNLVSNDDDIAEAICIAYSQIIDK